MFGSNGAKVITNTFLNNEIQDNLQTRLIQSSSRIVVILAESSHTRLILQEALDSDVLGPKFTWILSSSISLTSFNSIFYSKLIGMLIIEQVTGAIISESVNTTLLNTAYQIWKEYEPESFPGSMNVSNYALYTFDVTYSLIQSL
ncbi:unnamed protein product [Adineta steineri]|uniref:Receptor ligand binding region domain-containing protein n=1 Tax=Adineta steineri TaxID=433720 RepID=A0A816AHI7_9BILA|nr:unnamed protein product [Adineta steineri]CAF1597711.1 unnamed protein product [Adineta steineri]